jgi:molybdenum cofactor cytidylyltransferase
MAAMADDEVHGIVLAAGAASRMGRPKALLPLGTGTVLSHVVSRLLAAPLGRVVVVLGSHAGEVRRGAGLPVADRLTLVENAGWLEGVSTSLRCGLTACGEAAAVVVALGDQPGVDPEVVARLAAAWRAGAPLAAPVHSGRVGHPVLFGRSLFPELRGLTGDMGAREVVRRHWGEGVAVPALPLWDLDTETDYRAFLEGQPPPAEGLELPSSKEDRPPGEREARRGERGAE